VLLVGLTGGIGSGKSEVSRRFAALGGVVVDADLIAREVVEPGTPGLAQVVEAFGAGLLTADGALDRDMLAARVFGDDAARKRLNAIVHPLVGARSLELIAAAGERDPDAIVINDVPLLVEGGLAGRYQAVVVVDVDPDTQLRRLVQLRGMSEADARARIAVQATREQRLAVADYVIDNSGDLASLQRQVQQVWSALRDRAGRTMPR
jgi:dephospho-CoA kinase